MKCMKCEQGHCAGRGVTIEGSRGFQPAVRPSPIVIRRGATGEMSDIQCQPA